MITCMTSQLSALTFYANGRILASYAYSPTGSRPAVIHTGVIRIVVTEASGRRDAFSGTAVLTSTTLALNKLNAHDIQCGSDAIRSQSVNVRANVHGMCIHRFITIEFSNLIGQSEGF